MSMSNLIKIDIHFMNMKRHKLICFFKSLLVDREEKSERVIKWRYLLRMVRDTSTRAFDQHLQKTKST